MNYFWIVILCGCFLWSPLSACDVCGSAGNDNVFGLLPSFRTRFVGLRYQFQHFSVVHPSLFSNGEDSRAKNNYHSTAVWGRYGFLKNRVHVLAFLPYHYYEEIEETTERYTKSQGLGDLRLHIQALVLNTSDSASYKPKHSLQVGLGIKLPTAAYQLEDSNGRLLPANFQPGTGTIDLPMDLIYTFQYRKVGLNLGYNYTWRGPRMKSDYQFADQHNASLQFFYKQKITSLQGLIHAGLSYDYRAKDYELGQAQAFTGNKQLAITTGFRIFAKKCAFGLSGQLPVYQYAGDGYVQAHGQVNAQFMYLF